MRHARLVPAVGLLIALALADVAAAQELPRVRLVATGGTISNRAGGRLTADDLLGLIPDVRRVARPEAEQFSNMSSSELTLAQWLALSRRLNELFATETGPGGHRRDLRDRHARGTRLLPAPHRSRRPARRRRGVDAQSEHGRVRGRGEPARGVPGGGLAGRARAGRARGPQRRDQLRARGDQDRRPPAADVPEPHGWRAGRGRSGSRRVLPRRGEAPHGPQRVRRREARPPCRASTSCWSTRMRRATSSRPPSISAPGGSSSPRPAPGRPAAPSPTGLAYAIAQGRDGGGDHQDRQRPDLGHAEVWRGAGRRRGSGADRRPGSCSCWPWRPRRTRPTSSGCSSRY